MTIALNSLASIGVGNTNWGTIVNGYWSLIRTGTTLGQVDVTAPVVLSGATTLGASAFGKLHQISGTGPYTVTLPAATAADIGSLVGFVSGAGATIAPSGTDTLDGLPGVALLPTEFMVVLCTGAGIWRRIAHRFLDDWQAFTPTITATVTSPTKGATRVEKCSWRRDGADMLITFFYQQSVAGTSGSGTYKIAIPAGYTIDSTRCVFGMVSSAADAPTVVGAGHGYLYGVASGTGCPFTLDSGSLGFINSGQGSYQSIGSSWYAMSNTNLVISFQARVPISGWG